MNFLIKKSSKFRCLKILTLSDLWRSLDFPFKAKLDFDRSHQLAPPSDIFAELQPQNRIIWDLFSSELIKNWNFLPFKIFGNFSFFRDFFLTFYEIHNLSSNYSRKARTQNVRNISELADFKLLFLRQALRHVGVQLPYVFLSIQIWPTFNIIDKISVLKIIENSFINSNYWVW